VRVSDIVLVRPGEAHSDRRVVTQGSSHVDRSMVTGEPARLQEGRARRLRATVSNQRLFVSRHPRQRRYDARRHHPRSRAGAGAKRCRFRRWSIRVTAVFVPLFSPSRLTFVVWMLIGPERASHALVNAVAVLIIACPAPWGSRRRRRS
jgi:Cu+-exporting ATPase